MASTSYPGRLRGLLAKATPGPWRNEPVHVHLYNPSRDVVVTPGIAVVEPPGMVATLDYASPEENAELIVAAVNALPVLLDVLDAAFQLVNNQSERHTPDVTSSNRWTGVDRQRLAVLRTAIGRAAAVEEAGRAYGPAEPIGNKAE